MEMQRDGRPDTDNNTTTATYKTNVDDGNNNNNNDKINNAVDDEVLNVGEMDDTYTLPTDEKGSKNTYVNPAFDSNEQQQQHQQQQELRVMPPRPDTGLSVITTVSEETNSTITPNKYLYGWYCCTPEALQCFNRPFIFLMCLCMGVIAQGLTVSGISLASLTGIEKQFGFKSSEVALFLTVYDTAYGICSLFIGYIGTYHKPRYLGFGLLIMVCGAVLVSIPKFKIGQYDGGHQQADDFCYNQTTDGMAGQKNPACDEENAGWVYQLIFNIGFIILGFGATPLYTLGPAHIDDVTDRGTSSMYLGVFYAASAIGPAIGFIISTPLLKEWVELDNPPPFAKPTDPQWVGAWWVGFLIGAGLLLTPVFPMLGLSRIFPDTERLREKKRELADTVPENRELRLAWPAIKALLRNGPFICISLAIALEGLAIGGFSTFIPKYIETQFNITAAQAALYTGLMGIPSAAGGVFLGGFLVKRYKWNCKQILQRVTVMGFLATVLCAIVLAPCHDSVENQPVTSMEFNATLCNISCDCNNRYKPICTVQDQKTYYSPCYAGCFKNNLINETYVDCACFPPGISTAQDGKCRPDYCPYFPVFCVGIFFLVLASFLTNVPLINATFRVVNEGQGSFAMGFQQIFIRFLGFIPSPVMYGALIDRSCKLWQDDECGIEETSNCLEYDNDYFRYYMTVLAAVTKFFAAMFMLLAYKLYKLPPTNRTTPVGGGELGLDNTICEGVGSTGTNTTSNTPTPNI